MVRKRSFIIIAVVLLALFLAAFVSTRISAPDNSEVISIYSDGEEVHLLGQVVCLPHQDSDGPQTMECAYGFQDETGVYFHLSDTSGDYSVISAVPMNEPVRLDGIYRPTEPNQYKQSGKIEVTEINTLTP